MLPGVCEGLALGILNFKLTQPIGSSLQMSQGKGAETGSSTFKQKMELVSCLKFEAQIMHIAASCNQK